ncbi:MULTISPECIES: PfkB family carbohydrate kinase [unclassified Roseovarius]|uniref:PfkB family carbohydrate kinase n=1 Tax=unclassified Roseovarius TaxID=2614913 RepID=UPI00273F0E3F|nr:MULTISPECIES: PfkB family carbohydrate kinase [unclassified Roseovarius]
MTGRLLQLSGVIVDLIYDVVAVPKAGEEASVTGFSISPGGGFNAMIAAKRAGMEVFYGGSIGTGPFAEITKQGLSKAGIDALRSPVPTLDQGCSTVLVDAKGERTFIAMEGADGHVTPEDLSGIEHAQFDWALLSGYALHYAGSRAAFLGWLERGDAIPNLVFDPSPMVSEISRDLLEAALNRAHWVSANAQEATILTGEADPVKSAAALAARCPATGGAVVRTGAQGCVVATSQTIRQIAPYTVTPIDTNGAGDAHLGSFIAQLSEGKDPFKAAAYANVAAALSTTKKGPATAPERAVVEAAMQGEAAI